MLSAGRLAASVVGGVTASVVAGTVTSVVGGGESSVLRVALVSIEDAAASVCIGVSELPQAVSTKRAIARKKRMILRVIFIFFFFFPNKSQRFDTAIIASFPADCKDKKRTGEKYVMLSRKNRIREL